MARDVDKLHGQNEEEKEDKEHLELDEMFVVKFFYRSIANLC